MLSWVEHEKSFITQGKGDTEVEKIPTKTLIITFLSLWISLGVSE